MRFFTVVLTAVTAFTALVSAQSATETTSSPAPAVTDSKDNQINYPVGGTIGSGSPITIKWTPSTQGPITLVLRKGDGDNLGTITTIASGIPNSGSYDWTPSSSLPAGDDYAIQIISGSVSNYSPKFGIGSVSSSSSSTTTSTSTKSSSSSLSSSLPSSLSSSSSSSTTITSNSSSTSTSARATPSGANTTTSSTSRTSSLSTPTSTSPSTTGSGGANSINGAAHVASPLTLIFFIVAGIAYLN